MKKLLFIVFSFILSLSAQATELIQYNLRVDGMTCPFCLATSEKALKELGGVERVSSNLDTAIISVCGSTSLAFDELELTELFANKGFTYRSLEKLNSCSILDDDNLVIDEQTSDHSHEHSHHGEH